MNEEENRKRIRPGSFWNSPKVRVRGVPNIRHPNWNPHENKEVELDFY